MVETKNLAPHDPMPEGRGRRVIVLQRFDEDEPSTTVIELHLLGGGAAAEAVRPVRPDGTFMQLHDATEAAKAVAESEGLDVIYVLDRTAGPREQEILAHEGDHSVGMDTLQDTDPEDGEQGPDMRDRRA